MLTVLINEKDLYSVCMFLIIFSRGNGPDTPMEIKHENIKE